MDVFNYRGIISIITPRLRSVARSVSSVSPVMTVTELREFRKTTRGTGHPISGLGRGRDVPVPTGPDRTGRSEEGVGRGRSTSDGVQIGC